MESYCLMGTVSIFVFCIRECSNFILSHVAVKYCKHHLLEETLFFSSVYSCLEYPMNSVKRQNDRILKKELPRSVGAQYATGDQFEE